MRIIITGGRRRNDYYAVQSAILEYGHLGSNREAVTLVHGDCPTGIDASAAVFALRNSDLVTNVFYTADWEKYGRAAGPKRNEQMSESGADLCLAFPSRTRSPGTRDMIRRAVAHGIKTIIIPEGAE